MCGVSACENMQKRVSHGERPVIDTVQHIKPTTVSGYRDNRETV